MSIIIFILAVILCGLLAVVSMIAAILLIDYHIKLTCYEYLFGGIIYFLGSAFFGWVTFNLISNAEHWISRVII